MSFYVQTLQRLVADKSLSPTAPTLVVAGGPYDRECLLAAGFTNVTMSNLDVRMKGDEFAPYAWSFQDGENLDFPDGAFEQVIEHAGLHHCSSPHRGLLEMYRVASKAVLVFENRDSSLMRSAVKLGLTHDFELEAVVGNGGEFGGVRNTAVPNHVYRWTEREVRKTILSYDPARVPEIKFFYRMRLPTERLAMHRSQVRKLVAKVLTVPVLALSKAFPRQSNEFGFLVEKNGSAWPWIDRDTGSLARSYVGQKFKHTSQD